jgi:hypothetical protein
MRELNLQETSAVAGGFRFYIDCYFFEITLWETDLF